ncbi:hypothetical protein EDF56_107144 [Novosphingobium sp. PhB165]|uniref:hypothetical protein n=1 Tax=Novosphingobium sp. PhB165 TaxID=2485105 RepID=UPI001042B5DD|nr:hypothetical protein [Novosphingobium sp. PhB165]TCM16565.1 hypothetical protein EDF56_107144 [Novosphingobium sp. PhB165]
MSGNGAVEMTRPENDTAISIESAKRILDSEAHGAEVEAYINRVGLGWTRIVGINFEADHIYCSYRLALDDFWIDGMILCAPADILAVRVVP